MIKNTKRVHPGGFVSYYMSRSADDGQRFEYVLHLSPDEMLTGRDYVAGRLRRARQSMHVSRTDSYAS